MDEVNSAFLPDLQERLRLEPGRVGSWSYILPMCLHSYSLDPVYNYIFSTQTAGIVKCSANDEMLTEKVDL